VELIAMTKTKPSAPAILGLGRYERLEPMHRFARRREQRGVTVFIVMMAIVMLTGAGTWAMYSAGMTDQASGYARASAQAIYTAELGLISGSALLSVPGYADSNFSTAQQSQRSGTPDACWSSRGPGTTGTNVPFCKSMSMGNIDPLIQQETATFGAAFTLLDQVNQEGSLSPYASTHGSSIQGDFILEMTEPRPVTRSR
jgi:hypothetical protein